MKRLFFITLSFIFFASLSWAAPAKRSAGTSTATVPVKRSAPKEESYWQMGLNALIWQEGIEARRGTNTENLLVQSLGFGFDMTYRRPSSSIRWWQSHTLSLGVGSIHTTGTTTAIPDTLRQQQFYTATLSPGFIYRTTSVSDIGLSVPLTYRVINWVTNDDTLTLARRNSFSYGLSALYINRLTRTSDLQVSFTDQMSWKAFVWSVGWNHAFR
jgi:hypothetical protein